MKLPSNGSFRRIARFALLSLALPFSSVISAAQDSALPYVFTTFAGTVYPDETPSDKRVSVDGIGASARFKSPHGVAVDGAGNIYVTDLQDHTIRKITPGGAVTTLAGQSGQAGTSDGVGVNAHFGSIPLGIGATLAEFTGPYGLAATGDGTLYVADAGNHTIRKILPNGTVSTYAGVKELKGSADGRTTNATFNFPTGVAVGQDGYVYVADTSNHTIRRISPDGLVDTIAGTAGVSGSLDISGGSTGGTIILGQPPQSALFALPTGITVDSSGRILVGDSLLTIRRIIPSTTPPITVGGYLVITPADVQTVAGNAGRTGGADGQGPFATFGTNTVGTIITKAGVAGELSGLAFDLTGNLLITDTGNSTLRQYGTDGSVSTIGGAKNIFDAVDGVGTAARFASPTGIAVDRTGQVYVADEINGVIRKGVRATKPTIQTQPDDRIVEPGQNLTLTVAATGLPLPTYAWSKNGSVIAGATQASLALSNVQPAEAGTYTVTVTNDFGTATSKPANVTVQASVVSPTITTAPAPLTLIAGGNATLSVSVAGTAPFSYQWSRNGTPIAGATAGSSALNSTLLGDAGSYTVSIANSAGSVTSSAVTVAVTPVSRISNLSVLTSLSSSTDDFSLGYVVGGATIASPKPLVLRAVGPSLAALGVAGAIDDPKLELFTGSVATGSNDNWGGAATLSAAFSAVGAFPYAAPGSKDAASIANFTSRDNSVKISSSANSGGLVLAEIYDATPAALFTTATARLLNVSVRKNLGSGLTVGFTIAGSASKTVLIRAIGPTLGGFGVPGTVADPQLVLFDGQSTKVGANDNWGGVATLSSAFDSVGAFSLPGGSKDAVYLGTLAPGGYSVQVSGVNGTTGEALIEIYEVP